jgi:hypothetical protein
MLCYWLYIAYFSFSTLFFIDSYAEFQTISYTICIIPLSFFIFILEYGLIDLGMRYYWHALLCLAFFCLSFLFICLIFYRF